MEQSKDFSKRTFYCPKCSHKNVCKKIDVPGSACEDFINGQSYMEYPSIYQLFQPIFDWINYHYRSANVTFVVDHNSAKMYIENGPFVFDKRLTNNTSFTHMQNKTEEDKEK